MDYGQPPQMQKTPDFFTTGVGTNQENLNNFQPENNLNLDQANWNGQSEKNNRNIGNVAMISPETSSDQEPDYASQTETSNPTNLGQVINFEMPPDTVENEASATIDKQADQVMAFDRNNIKTSERLDALGVKEVQKAIVKLNQDGNIADFYDTAREMMAINLENSYNRKLAA